MDYRNMSSAEMKFNEYTAAGHDPAAAAAYARAHARAHFTPLIEASEPDSPMRLPYVQGLQFALDTLDALESAAAQTAAEGADSLLRELITLSNADSADPVQAAALSPAAIALNAYRIYDHLEGAGIPEVDSSTREAAFSYASAALGIEYGMLYDAWLAGRG